MSRGEDKTNFSLDFEKITNGESLIEREDAGEYDTRINDLTELQKIIIKHKHDQGQSIESTTASETSTQKAMRKLDDVEVSISTRP